MIDKSRAASNASAADELSVTVLNFDNFDEQSYGGFVWEHFDESVTDVSPAEDGSENNVALNLWAQGSNFRSLDGSFDLQSLSLIGVYERLSVTIVGVSAGEITYTQTVTIPFNQAKTINLDWQGIDRVYFDVDPNGTQNPSGLYFQLDNLTYSWSGGSVSGSLILDANANGIVDAGESGLARRTVILDDNGNGVVDAGERSTTTDATGAYHFAAVADGAHTVTQVLPDTWAQTGAQGPTAVSVVDGGDATADLLSGRARDVLGSVAGTVFHDADLSGTRGRGDVPLAGWTVFLDTDGDGIRDAGERSVQTDANGRYLFEGLAPGEAAIRVELPLAWQQWSGGATTAAVTAGTRTGGADLAVTGGATSGDDRLVGIANAAETIAALRGDDRVIARGGGDRVDGGAGDDLLGGGRGDDWLFGGAGNDRLIGGTGADVFVIDGAGVDRIADFAAGDRIHITAAGVDAFEDLAITARGDTTVIGWAGTDVAVVLRGVAPDALDASAFVFGG